MKTSQPGQLRIGGLVPFTTVDYPGRLSAVIFCQGCPWRCRYCHNAHLQPFRPGSLQWQEVLSFLRERQGLLEAVVFSGGEPAAQPHLLRAVAAVKELGYLAGLHTAGMYPSRLRRLLPLLDWVGFDVKAPFDPRYDLITGRRDSARPVLASLQHLLASGVAYQIRTTVHPAMLDTAACLEITRQLERLGALPAVWQECRRILP